LFERIVKLLDFIWSGGKTGGCSYTFFLVLRHSSLSLQSECLRNFGILLK